MSFHPLAGKITKPPAKVWWNAIVKPTSAKRVNPYIGTWYPWFYEKPPKNYEGVPFFGGERLHIWRRHPDIAGGEPNTGMMPWNTSTRPERVKMKWMLPGWWQGLTVAAIYIAYD